MKLGVCYYPEHWPEQRWGEDARLMHTAGLSLVRIGEFAWGLIEPAEGHYEWDWLDRAFETLAAEGLRIILGTPTAAPPAWLTHSYPDVLPVDEAGRRRKAGTRRHYCFNSPDYLALSKNIVSGLAKRFGSHPSLHAWQIDNEFGSHQTTRCYCNNCTRDFRSWLQQKYETLEKLNQSWGTVFWSQLYSSWEQIELPNLTLAQPNPSHWLDYARFASDSVTAFQQMQIDILQTHSPGVPVTHNVIPNLSDINLHQLARKLDRASCSVYPTGLLETSADRFYVPGEEQPVFAYDAGDPVLTGFNLELVQGLKQAPFTIMEQQCGQVNWSRFNTGIRPGTPRLWTLHALSAGADEVLYFRWRAGLSGDEQHHSGLLRHDGSPDVGFQDLLKLQQDLPLLQQICTEPQVVETALILDYEDLWALGKQPHHEYYSTFRLLFCWYRAFQQAGIPCAILPPHADLSPLKLAILPTTWIGKPDLAARLEQYVQHGGTLLMGLRSGFKTTTNTVNPYPLPGVFRKLLNIHVSDWHALPPGQRHEIKSDIPDLAGQAAVWIESLKPDSPQTLVHATWNSGPFSGSAALTEYPSGTGQTFYMGWFPSADQARSLVHYLAGKAGITSLHALPDGVLVSRFGEHSIYLNFSDSVQTISVDGETCALPARDYALLEHKS
ncbi:MAG: beta-galactosidase [Anaerolineales bacterium]|nr:beta-galactosidase [Anaerolineales bacterium]